MTALCFMLMLGAFLGLTQLDHQVGASPSIVGNPANADSRLLIATGERIVQVNYFNTGARTMGNGTSTAAANTPVSSGAKCALYGDLHKVEIRYTGGITGTNPVLTFKWQNSLDGGNTWTDVGTFVGLNATVTPANQVQSVGDIRNATTAVAFGDCWRMTYTFAGSGTVTANFTVKGLDK